MNRREFIGTCALLLSGAAMPRSVFSAGMKEAANNSWKLLPLTTERMQVLGIDGGDGFQYVHALTYAPSHPEVAYLGVDQSGVWRSDDGGRSWGPKFNGFYSLGARSIAVDPLNPLVVVAAGFLGFNAEGAAKYPNRYQGIYLTVNGGESWQMVRKTEFYKQASKGHLVVFDSTGGENSKQRRSDLAWCASHSEGLLKSIDGGESWQNTDFRKTGVHDLALIPDGSGRLLIASPEGLWGYGLSGIEKLGQGLPDFPRSIALSRGRPLRVYAALGPAGVAVSNDGGRSFSSPRFGFVDFFTKIDVTDIAVSPVDVDKVYLRGNRSGQPPYYSDDGGKTWNSPKLIDPEGVLGSPGFYFSSPFAPHPSDPKTCLHVTNGRARVIRTDDGGVSWHFSGSGFTGARMSDIAFLGPGKMIFCFTDHGLWETTDNGQTFSEMETMRIDNAKSVSAVAANSHNIVAGFGKWGEKGLIVSQNSGKDFTAFRDLKDNFHFVAFHPKIVGLVYAGPFVSDDFGQNWRSLPETVRAMSPDGKILYALDSPNKQSLMIMTSMDGGLYFMPEMELDLPLESINQIVVTPLHTIFLATTRGIYRIENGQVELRDYRHGLAKDNFGTMFVNTVAYDPNDPKKIFAGRRALGYGNGNGVFVSYDNGKSWNDINLNLSPGISVFAIKVNPFDSSVYIGTSFGTFRLDKEDVNDSKPDIIKIKQINENSSRK